MEIPAFINELRRSRGLLTVDDIQALVENGNIVFDPFSVLIAAKVKVGTGNVIYPCVYLLADGQGALTIGDNNTFHSNTLIEATSGPITVGSSNQFGEGGFTAKTNRPGAQISIGDDGRYVNGVTVFGETVLGTGSQILGAITVDSCELEGGLSYRDPDPDRRAGLLKGAGVARNLTVPAGKVIFGNGTFSLSDTKPQSFFHPRPK